jgi:hypothetical protein
MWIIVVFILALGAGIMTYRAATDYKTELAEPSAAKSQATQEKLFPTAKSIPPLDQAPVRRLVKRQKNETADAERRGLQMMYGLRGNLNASAPGGPGPAPFDPRQ